MIRAPWKVLDSCRSVIEKRQCKSELEMRFIVRTYAVRLDGRDREVDITASIAVMRI